MILKGIKGEWILDEKLDIVIQYKGKENILRFVGEGYSKAKLITGN